MHTNHQENEVAPEQLLALIGFSKDHLITKLTENSLEATPHALESLIHRLTSTLQHAVTEELDEALLTLRFPDMLTKRQAHALRSHIAQEIAEDDDLRSYFGHCCGIEVEHVSEHRFLVHLYYEAHGRDYAECWIRDEATWKKVVADIHEEMKEEWA